MKRENKHYGLKIILLLIVAFGVWIAFWKAPAPMEHVEKTLGHEALHL